MSMPVRADRVARFLELIEHEAETLESLEQRIAEGEGLPAICKSWDVPYARVIGWLMADAKRYEVYCRALEVAAHALVAETVELASGKPRVVRGQDGKPELDDEGEPIVAETPVPRSRLEVETRFRVAAAHAPALYGRREELIVPPILVVNASLERVADALLERLSGRTIEQPHLAEESADEGDI